MSDPLIERLAREAQRQGWSFGHHVLESFVTEVGLACLRPGDCAIDVGAHKGRHAVPWARRVGRTGHVFAFEPLPRFAAWIQLRRLRHWLPQLHVRRSAVANRRGHASFTYFPDRPAFSGLLQRDAPSARATQISVPLTRLDDRPWPKHPLRLLKLDVEGGEYDALLGARNLLHTRRPRVIFECGRRSAADLYQHTADDLFDLFDHADYQVYTLGGRRFTRADWDLDLPSWEFLALPRDDLDLLPQLPLLAERALERARQLPRSAARVAPPA